MMNYLNEKLNTEIRNFEYLKKNPVATVEQFEAIYREFNEGYPNGFDLMDWRNGKETKWSEEELNFYRDNTQKITELYISSKYWHRSIEDINKILTQISEGISQEQVGFFWARLNSLRQATQPEVREAFELKNQDNQLNLLIQELDRQRIKKNASELVLQIVCFRNEESEDKKGYYEVLTDTFFYKEKAIAGILTPISRSDDVFFFSNFHRIRRKLKLKNIDDNLEIIDISGTNYLLLNDDFILTENKQNLELTLVGRVSETSYENEIEVNISSPLKINNNNIKKVVFYNLPPSLNYSDWKKNTKLTVENWLFDDNEFDRRDLTLAINLEEYNLLIDRTLEEKEELKKIKEGADKFQEELWIQNYNKEW